MKSWPKVKLGEACAINPKVAPPSPEQLISVVPMSAVSESGEIDASDVRPFADVAKGLTLFQEGDVLFAKITPCMENGKGAVAVGLRGGVGAGSTEFFVLRPDGERALSAWIYHFTKRAAFRRSAAERMTGSAGQRRVPRAFLERVALPLPPLDEQARIVAELDAVAATLKKRQTQLAELDALVQARFVELFGDPATNPKQLQVLKLKDLATKITDGAHTKPNYAPTGKPFISVVNITKKYVDFSDCKYVSEEDYRKITKSVRPEKGDVLYTKVGTCGIPAYVDTDREFCLYVSVCLIKPRHNLINARFLAYSMEQPYVKRQADRRVKGIGVPDLHLNQIRDFDILAPKREDQDAFIDFVAQVEAVKASVRDGIAETRTLFDALSQRYFG